MHKPDSLNSNKTCDNIGTMDFLSAMLTERITAGNMSFFDTFALMVTLVTPNIKLNNTLTYCIPIFFKYLVE